jgi:hypothetical protein
MWEDGGKFANQNWGEKIWVIPNGPNVINPVIAIYS